MKHYLKRWSGVYYADGKAFTTLHDALQFIFDNRR